MTSNENIPPGDIASKENTSTTDVNHEVKVLVSDEGTLPSLMGPLVIRSSNMSCPTTVNDRRSPELTRSSEAEIPSNPQDSKLDHDKFEQTHHQPEPSDAELSELNSGDDDIENDQEDRDEYDFEYEDDDIPIDDDPFFGVADTKKALERSTQDQMDSIMKIMEANEKAAEEEAKNQKAIQRILSEDVEPPALISNDNTYNDDLPDLIEPPHPLLSDQNYNATDMLISVRSDFGGDVYHVVGMTEPLGKMKLKFFEAVNLDPSEYHTVEFVCGYHVIQDDDTVEKVCCSPYLLLCANH